jgi:hypothetical protein
VKTGRWIASLVVGYVVTSALNWFVAEKFLNDLIRPGFGALMRDRSDTQVGVLVGGFALPVLVTCILCALIRAPQGWVGRGLTAGGLVSLASFFGSYTFLSGWLRLPTGTLCQTAIADSLTVIFGALVMAYIQKSTDVR